MCLVYKTASDMAEPEAILRTGGSEQGLLFDSLTVESNAEIAQATESALRKRVSGRMMYNTWLAMLSNDLVNDCKVDMALWRVLANIWRYGKRKEFDLADESAQVLRGAMHRTSHEYIRYIGVTRFRDIGGLFYAELEPDCDVLPLLAEHFSARLADQSWIIHDLCRKKAALYNMKTWVITDITPQFPSEKSKKINKADKYQDLWREFFRSTTTIQRLNYKTQRGHMAKKYWKHLTETPGELHGKM